MKDQFKMALVCGNAGFAGLFGPFPKKYPSPKGVRFPALGGLKTRETRKPGN